MLDSFNDASFPSSGSQFDRSYYVDFKQLVVEDADLDKSANIKKNVIHAVKKPSPPSMNEMQPLLEPDLNFA